MKVDKRMTPRVGVQLTITRFGVVMNISETGMCVISDEPLPIDYLVKVTLSLPDLLHESEEVVRIVSIEGVVVWTKFSEQLDKHEVGIKFTNLEDDNKVPIKSFIENYSRNYSK